MAHDITIRLLPDSEWARLKDIYAANGWELPSPEHNRAVVAEHAGEIIGMWGMNAIAHAGPLYVAPEFRKQGIAVLLGRGVEREMLSLAEGRFLVFASNPGSIAVARKLGYREHGWKVFEAQV
ncbi:MAG TPA: GNAT family N-acetyltransferase [Bryobacteraceae bacterium]|nr:GNAT family N-acetyltransferase [Bryobacteraceae bacterium]